MSSFLDPVPATGPETPCRIVPAILLKKAVLARWSHHPSGHQRQAGRPGVSESLERDREEAEGQRTAERLKEVENS